jgi:hypothetical protein
MKFRFKGYVMQSSPLVPLEFSREEMLEDRRKDHESSLNLPHSVQIGSKTTATRCLNSLWWYSKRVHSGEHLSGPTGDVLQPRTSVCH